MTNRLTGATSPYLIQHASNPVDWFQWGPEAFAEARERDVPIFLSVGYAACHWCHVMAHESFEDPQTAAVLNGNFVSIKVDREERPDIDAVYMAATTALTGQGGWPMSVWLDHRGLAFYAGTYFPPAPMHGRPSFVQILTAISDAWTSRRDGVLRSAKSINDALVAQESGTDPPIPEEPPDEVIAVAATALGELFDRVDAGFGGAPKFPPAMVLEFLLRHHELTGDVDSLDMVAATCEAMARGGMYDQLAGGFARYSVDAGWVVPHFEKMLYDNALLLRVYTHLWRLTDSDLARRVAEETATFLLRDLVTEEGGFAAALDADAVPVGRPDGPAVEGASYAWTPDGLDHVLGPVEGEWAAQLLGVTIGGTFEHGASTLQLRTDPDDPQRWRRVRARLLAARDQRPQPRRDDKVVASWNGLAITALVQAGVVFGEPEWVTAAVETGRLLVSRHVISGRLMRVSRAGRVGSAAAVLDDYGNVIEALTELLAATGDSDWYDTSVGLATTMVERFAIGDNGFCDTADDAEALVRRPRDPSDNASPGGTSAAVAALVRMAALSGDTSWRTRAELTLRALSGLQTTHPRFAGWSSAALAAATAGPVQIAIVGAPDDPMTAQMVRAAFRGAHCGAVIAQGDGEATSVPLLSGRTAIRGMPTAYVCRDFVCSLPVNRAEELQEQLDSLKGG